MKRFSTESTKRGVQVNFESYGVNSRPTSEGSSVSERTIIKVGPSDDICMARLARHAVVICFLTGMVNGIAYVGHMQAIPTAMTGATTRIAVAAAKASLAKPLAPATQWGPALLQVFSHLGGALAGGLVTASPKRRNPRTMALLALVVGLALVVAAVCNKEDVTEARYLLSFVMGLQNSIVTVCTGFVRTTHVTGTLCDVGILLGQAASDEHRSAESVWKLLVLLQLFLAFGMGAGSGAWLESVALLKEVAFLVPAGFYFGVALFGFIGVAHDHKRNERAAEEEAFRAVNQATKRLSHVARRSRGRSLFADLQRTSFDSTSSFANFPGPSGRASINALDVLPRLQHHSSRESTGAPVSRDQVSVVVSNSADSFDAETTYSDISDEDPEDDVARSKTERIAADKQARLRRGAYKAAVCAGAVNAATWLQLQTFSTHVTGSTIKVGILAAQLLDAEQRADFPIAERRAAEGRPAPLYSLLLCYLLGSTFSGAWLRHEKSVLKAGEALLAASFLLFAAAACLQFEAARVVALLLSVGAMGVQNAAVTMVTGFARTTHVTGTLTDIGALVGQMADPGNRVTPGITKATALVLLWLSFLTGAAFTTALLEAREELRLTDAVAQSLALALPGLGLALLALRWLLWARREQGILDRRPPVQRAAQQEIAEMRETQARRDLGVAGSFATSVDLMPVPTMGAASLRRMGTGLSRRATGMGMTRISSRVTSTPARSPAASNLDTETQMAARPSNSWGARGLGHSVGSASWGALIPAERLEAARMHAASKSSPAGFYDGPTARSPLGEGLGESAGSWRVTTMDDSALGMAGSRRGMASIPSGVELSRFTGANDDHLLQ